MGFMFKSKTHETNFYNAMKEVDSENFATQAVVYLLTSETTLWGKVKKHFKDGYIDALSLHPKASSKNAYKDDLLFISYDKPIVETKDKFGYDIQEGYEAVLYGHMTFDFIRVVRKYQNYDIKPIADEVKKKEAFYREKSPEECSLPGIDWLE